MSSKVVRVVLLLNILFLAARSVRIANQTFPTRALIPFAFSGNGDLTFDEAKTHFTAWALMKSPLLIGTDVSAYAFPDPLRHGLICVSSARVVPYHYLLLAHLTPLPLPSVSRFRRSFIDLAQFRCFICTFFGDDRGDYSLQCAA